MKKVAILGSTGSIGTQTLNVIRQNSDKLKVVSLVAYANETRLAEQVKEFAPRYHALISRDGEDCLVEAVKYADIAVIATRGIVALPAVMYCLRHNIDIALANKETLVCGGNLVTSAKTRAHLYPVDSEHAAIRQCLVGNTSADIDKILLTASGGPFYDYNPLDLSDVTPEQALAHPNWTMGDKITVDSATMMNKALEVVEASYLFGVPTDKIKIIVHRQSLVHSMVQFSDGSVVAQLAAPNMQLPILQALLGYNEPAVSPKMDFDKLVNITFQPCDFTRFPCAKLGYEIGDYPPLSATVMNAANDECVDAFLHRGLCFTSFYNIIKQTIDNFADMTRGEELTVENIKKFDRIARIYARNAVLGE